MQKILLLLFIFLFHGCSINTLFPSGEVNKVMVVKYLPYMKHHRAYFKRAHLENIQGRKYLFLYNHKNHDLAVLFHNQDKYILYNMSKPKLKPLIGYPKKTTTLKTVLRSFKHKGFQPIQSLSSIGYITTVAKRRYKDIKTLLIETKDYTRLQTLYKKAIKDYDAHTILHIKTKLPKSLIYTYYRFYKKHAKSKIQLAQLQIIGEKLHIEKKEKKSTTPAKKSSKKISKKNIKKELNIVANTHTIPLKQQKEEIPKVTKPKIQKEEIVQIKKVKEITPPAKPYKYYLYQSSLAELSSYISNKTTKNALTYNQYTALTYRIKVLKEEKLFNEGSLEELIAAYKINKNPKYKKRIMLLMKEKQDTL